MRPIGFSTGALAHGDFRRGLAMSAVMDCEAVELSALRQAELIPLLNSLDSLDLAQFSYISIHAPSYFEPDSFQPNAEAFIWSILRDELWRKFPIVLHPDAIHDFSLWRQFGAQVCVENMDKRKPVGRSAKELGRIFDKLPDASLCFDIGHARQCDPTMTEAYLILKHFGAKLRQVHLSEVNTASKHDPLSWASIMAFQDVAHLIPNDVPLILETPVGVEGMAAEIGKAREAMPVSEELVGITLRDRV